MTFEATDAATVDGPHVLRRRDTHRQGWLLLGWIAVATAAACGNDGAPGSNESLGPDAGIPDAGLAEAATTLCTRKCAAIVQVPCATMDMDACMAVCVPGNTGVCGAPATALDTCLVAAADRGEEPWFCFLGEVAIKQEVCRMEQDALYSCQLQIGSDSDA